jgi:hypothetical protein
MLTLLTSFMELIPSSETTSCADTQELSNILWNPKAYCRVHKSPPPITVLNWIIPVHTTQIYLSKIHFNIIDQPTSWSS